MLSRWSLTSALLLAITLSASSGTVVYGRATVQTTRSIASKVALIHFNPDLGRQDENIRALSILVEEAFNSRANFVVAPELASTGYFIRLQDVMDELGLERPFSKFSKIRDLAIKHRGYVFLGFAEVQRPAKAYNSVVVFGPKGLVYTGRKRALPLWNARGDVPFEIVSTPFGEVGTVICADSFLPDWIRILTLKGADIILSPANWWGPYGQEEIWQTRARENGVWMVVANRWGREVDDAGTPPSTYNMNDAPSDVISPEGAIKLSYRAEQVAAPTNKILYYTLRVPASRIGNATNRTYTVAHRRPEAYQAIGNLYYRPDMGRHPAPDLPSSGRTQVGVIAYEPASDAHANLANLRRLWSTQRADVLVLPGLGISVRPVKSYRQGWIKESPWRELQDFVNERRILLLATTVRERFDKTKPPRESVLVIRLGHPAKLYGQIHRAGAALGTGQSPTPIDLPHARVAVVTGVDALFPELSTHLAKQGVDLVIVSSSVSGKNSGLNPQPSASVWDKTALLQAWKTSTNHGFHLTAADSGGFGLLIEAGFPGRKEVLDQSQPVKVLDLDSTPLRRARYLNTYYPFDLKVLLGISPKNTIRDYKDTKEE